jgi:hypothetical protein
MKERGEPLMLSRVVVMINVATLFAPLTDNTLNISSIRFKLQETRRLIPELIASLLDP